MFCNAAQKKKKKKIFDFTQYLVELKKFYLSIYTRLTLKVQPNLIQHTFANVVEWLRIIPFQLTIFWKRFCRHTYGPDQLIR